MTHDKPDYERVLALLQSTPGRYYPTYEIASIVGIMDNTVHRALDTLENKRGLKIEHKRDEKNWHVMSYAWPVAVPVDRREWRQVDTLCGCGKSWYVVMIGGRWVCNKCGVDRA